MRMHRIITPGCLVVLALGASLEANTLNRNADPVVLTGAELGSLAGLSIDRIVAF